MPRSVKPSSGLSAQERGRLGEILVSQWLQQQGWTIVAERWHCPWGEIDVIAQGVSVSGQAQTGLARSSALCPTIAFVEVKTRGTRNLDTGGAQAITLRKRQKLWQTAELFLSDYTQFSDWNCRFDVALVTCDSLKPDPHLGLSQEHPETVPTAINTIETPIGRITIGTPILWQGYRLNLHRYLVNVLDEF